MTSVPNINVVHAPFQKPAQPARAKRRHRLMAVSFLIWVLAPMLICGLYLYRVAQDQYASEIGFTVQKEELGSTVELLGGLSALSGNSSSDADILYKFIRSRQMVVAVDQSLDLKRIYHNAADPVFSLKEDPNLEDIEAYWNRAINVAYDSATGLIEVRTLAFTAQDAQDVAQIILNESSQMINELSRVAREDSISYAEDERDRAAQRLKSARMALAEFRTHTQVVNPMADIEGRMGLLNNLQEELADTLIELDLLTLSSKSNAPRVTQTQRRADVIRSRILKERDRFGSDTLPQGEGFSNLVGEYESLTSDLGFAQKTYLSTLATYDAAVADAQRKSRYLATYMGPTLATSPQYPQRATYILLIASCLILSWGITMLVYYSVRDRK